MCACAYSMLTFLCSLTQRLVVCIALRWELGLMSWDVGHIINKQIRDKTLGFFALCFGSGNETLHKSKHDNEDDFRVQHHVLISLHSLTAWVCEEHGEKKNLSLFGECAIGLYFLPVVITANIHRLFITMGLNSYRNWTQHEGIQTETISLSPQRSQTVWPLL